MFSNRTRFSSSLFNRGEVMLYSKIKYNIEKKKRGFDIFFIVATSTCSSRSYIARVYVYRRPLAALKLFGKRCQLAHSGLILKMRDGRECVLEYMGDGRAHLYNANYRKKGPKWRAKLRGAWPISITDYQGNRYTRQSTRQYKGTAVSKRITPQQARSYMQRRMGYNYNLLKNNCHLGQERTRRYLGLTVRDAYKNPLSSPGKLCQCVRGIPGLARYLFSSNPYVKLLVSVCHLRG